MRKGRLVIAVVMAGLALLTYYGMRETNPITGEKQAIGLSKEQEVAIGLQSAPQMAAEFGGLDPDASLQSDVAAIGQKIVSSSRAKDTRYEFQFKVLADPETVNAFALPGGPVFITRALLQSDTLGVDFMSDAGYDPRAMLAVMDILARSSGGSKRAPEFLSTHPDPGNRQAVIQQAIQEKFPNGVPTTLTTGRPIALGRTAGGPAVR